MKSKKLSARAGLTIPKDLRAATGLLGGIAVDLIPREDGILMRKHVPTCDNCGSINDVRKIEVIAKELCRECIAKIRKELA